MFCVRYLSLITQKIQIQVKAPIVDQVIRPVSRLVIHLVIHLVMKKKSLWFP